MNQILVTNINYFNYNSNSKKRYILILFISLLICILILSYLIYLSFSLLTSSVKTNLLKTKYNINTLYDSNTTKPIIAVSNNISIIGLLEIPKINISYPIIANCNKDLLKISVCKFSGPLPNRIGNLCIAGHNYKNDTMFSKLNKLNLGDSIYITDLNNTKLEYIIYDKFKVNENNLNCIKNTDNVEVTLITCYTNDNSKRTIIKAKVKG